MFYVSICHVAIWAKLFVMTVTDDDDDDEFTLK